MQVKNSKGEVETMRYGPAMAAVEAGTHTIVNLDEDGKPKAEKSKAKKSDEKKSG
ncbi:hypothetical protein SAMN06297251_102131 [Fulvimarina manganoxydans]|uniref:Uncharacterized protein n=1 Tax=Fulvimarina manganoxydans TaxID=937218 RepID=A0A1W1Z3I8_9HYPH|nr:hypothetical protein [Fulvimarina manganoxydans]SMC43005.1 hypothetical protein SAMN06297251_102131 [Fulvimarina manganoxydans]